MDHNPSVFDLRALVRKVALEQAIELSGPRAHELWRVMQLVTAGKSLNGLPGAVLRFAMDFKNIPDAWKVIEEKALRYERNTGSAS